MDKLSNAYLIICMGLTILIGVTMLLLTGHLEPLLGGLLAIPFGFGLFRFLEWLE